MNRLSFLLLGAVLALVFTTCTNDVAVDPDIDFENATIWTGSTITFSKAAGADITDAANQDRITDNVWITRGNGGGQMHNLVDVEICVPHFGYADRIQEVHIKIIHILILLIEKLTK